MSRARILQKGHQRPPARADRVTLPPIRDGEGVERSSEESWQRKERRKSGAKRPSGAVGNRRMPLADPSSSRAKVAGEVEGHVAVRRGVVTSLMYACQQNRETQVRELLAQKSDCVLLRDRTMKSALHYCVENSNSASAELVLAAAPDLLDAPDQEGFTPLHLAVIAGNLQLVRFLLHKRADLTAVDNEKHSVVHWATVCGEVEALEALLDAGASASSPDIHGGYPIHYASQMCGANSEMGNDVKVGLKILKTLLARKVDVNVVDEDGRQPILWAASAGSADAVLSLVNAGSAVEAEDKDGLTALHCAASRGHTECLETLITLCGAEVNVIDANGCSALFYAVTLGHADCTQLLLNFGSDHNMQDRRGRTAAHCGAAKGQLETLKLLSTAGADLWKRNVRGDLPLHDAVQSGRRELVRWLLALRPDMVTAANSDGRSGLHIAATANNVEMCRVLLDSQSFVNPVMRNSKGNATTPLDSALVKENRGCAKYLQLHGGVPATKLTEEAAAIRGPQRALTESQMENLTPRPDSYTHLGVSPRGALNFDTSGATTPAIQPENLQIPPVDQTTQTPHEMSSDVKMVERGSSARGSKKSHRSRKTARSTPSSSDSEEAADASSKSEEKGKHRKPRGRRKSASKKSTKKGDEKRDQKEENSDISDDEDTATTVKTEIDVLSAAKAELTEILVKEVPKASVTEEKEKTTKPVLEEKLSEGIKSSEVKKINGAPIKDDSCEKIVEAKNETKRESSPPKSSKGNRPKSGKRQSEDSKKNLEMSSEEVLKESQQVEENKSKEEEKKMEDCTVNNELNTISGPIIIIEESPSVMMEEEDQEEKENISEIVASAEVKKEAEQVEKEEPKADKEMPSADENKIEPEKHAALEGKTVDCKIDAEKVFATTAGQDSTSCGPIEEVKNKLENVQSIEKEPDEATAPEVVVTQAVVHEECKPSDQEPKSPKKEAEAVKSESEIVQDVSGEKMSLTKSSSAGIAYVLEGDESKLANGNQNKFANAKGAKPSNGKKDKPSNGNEVETSNGNESKLADEKTLANGNEIKVTNGNDAKIKKKKSPPGKREPSVEMNKNELATKEKIEAAKKSRLSRAAKKDDLSKIKSKSEDRNNSVKQKENNASIKNRRRSQEKNSEEKSKSISEEGSLKSSAQASLEDPNLDESSDASDRSKAADSGVMMIEPPTTDSPKGNKLNKSRGIVKIIPDGDDKAFFNGKPSQRVTPTISRDLTKINARNNKAQIEEDEKKAREIIRKRHEQSVVSVTQAVQVSTRKYQLERKIFQELLELKKLQIRAGRANESILVKRAVDEYRKAGLIVGLRQYDGPYSFRSFEQYLYDQLQLLQHSSDARIIARLKPTDDVESLTAALKRSIPGNIHHSPAFCTLSTHRCNHASDAYTTVPVPNYVGRLPRTESFLPRIETPLGHMKPSGSLIMSPTKGLRFVDPRRPVTLELSHGGERQVIALPTERLDRTKRYYVTFTIKPGDGQPSLLATAKDEESPTVHNKHKHATSL